MNGEEKEEAPRARPLSAGIWTLFSWLRRSDRSSSSESVASVGSDRTVASFDYLAPFNYKHATTPLTLPQDPLTDTYKKRLHERNLRRQHDRDLTLCRKYGLFREDGLGYDNFSLPATRRLQKDSINIEDRERRATSESIQRRSAYVPGKRRAPLPPVLNTYTSLPRNYKRKKAAPKPPIKLPETNKENIEIIEMNPTTDIDKYIDKINDFRHEVSLESKFDKPLKTGKDVKLRRDKNLLKHIFDNKKRRSAIDTSHVKLLPSISELDKQAAEIIEAKKVLQASGDNSIGSSMATSCKEEIWMCSTCLRKYKTVVKCCIYCVIKENSFKNNAQSTINNGFNMYTQTDIKPLKSARESEIDDKKKLREMLKEMKDSLPKRHNDKFGKKDITTTSTEMPTLRIGTSVEKTLHVKSNNNNILLGNKRDNQHNIPNPAKSLFFESQPSSSGQFSKNYGRDNDALRSNKLFSHPAKPKSTVNSLDNVETATTVKAIQITSDNEKTHFLKHPGTTLLNKAENTELLNECIKTKEENKFELDNETKFSNRDNINTNNLINHTPQNIESKKDELAVVIKNNGVGGVMCTQEVDNKKYAHNIHQIPAVSIQKCKIPHSVINNKTQPFELSNESSKAINIDQSERSGGIPNRGKNIDLHTPLKISSLLNPLYCPKYDKCTEKFNDSNIAEVSPTKDTTFKSNKTKTTLLHEQTVLENNSTTTQRPSISKSKVLPSNVELETNRYELEHKNVKTRERTSDIITASSSKRFITKSLSPIDILGNHDKRRNLINKLEQAISKGDEHTAAEAAAKLAKLKLSCSVLSFSSQIVAETPTIMSDLKNTTTEKDLTLCASNTEKDSDKDNAEIQEKGKIHTTICNEEVNIQATASTSNKTYDEILPIAIWVEDKEATRGPIPLRISRIANIGDLKHLVATKLGLEIRLQRWIIGKTLCTTDNTKLSTLAGPDFTTPFYLYLVDSEATKSNSQRTRDIAQTQCSSKPNELNEGKLSEVYTELMKLEQQALVPNTEEFECGVCIERCPEGAGAVLRECIHVFCRECLADVVRHCDEPVVACPAIECSGALQEREIRALLSPEEHERWLARSLTAAENSTRNTFHCRTKDCKGWAFCDSAVRRFPCPVCKHTNCVPCQAVHEGETCEQYQIKLHEPVSDAETKQTDEGTQAFLKSLISKGEALECPECNTIITKKWGCDWVKCSACKTEICWVTKGRRWGPAGKGDTSAGCKCGIDGKRCHPSCGYCH